MEDGEDDVAVIGIGCNFPGGEGLDNFWTVLSEGRNCAVDIPTERFDSSFWCDQDEHKPGKMQTSKAALIDGFNEFDHRFFGISEAEADFMDPQQKLLLHCTYRALEDAGVAMESISGSRTGVYIGIMNRDYEMLRNNSASTITHYNGTGTAMSIAANRISFTFNLTGPSLAIDSACSSSLVALHLACQAIKQGDCEMAVCGGVSCIIEPRVFVALSKAKMISPDGTSKPFSSRADGYGRGEGCGVVLLKPLKNAIRDCNKIWGIVSKTAVNQDGHLVAPITKPSIVQQEELLRSIYSKSDVANVQYIEAHGTGTPIGDTTEAGSISNVIAKARPRSSKILWIGSVKGNIGHTESAAGVAGLIKVLLMMKYETIVSSVFYSEDSASIDVRVLSISIPNTAEKWKANESIRRVAGINSFGFGGTNAHVIVKDFMQTTVPTMISSACHQLFVISAASEKSLISSIADTHQRLSRDQSVDVQALSYTSTCGRSHTKHKYRKAFLISSLSDLNHQLISALKEKVESTRSSIKVVYVFSGSGVAYRCMCQQLLKEVPVFRDTVRKVEKLFCRHRHINILQTLTEDINNDDFTKPEVVQPLLFAVQVGIAYLLKHWGINPVGVLGHSFGEIAAAHCSGLLSLKDAVKVLYQRSTLQSKVTAGKMLVVGNIAVDKILDVLTAFSGKICIAAFNSPTSCTLSGGADAIDNLCQKLKTLFADKDLLLHILDVSKAYHSHMMDPILCDIEKSIGALAVNNTQCQLFSTVTGQRSLDGDFSTGKYWANNIRQPVLFKQTLCAIATDKQSSKNLVFVEIGPRRALQRYIHETLGKDVIVLPSVHPEKDYNTILSTITKLFELGIHVDWRQMYSGCETLPTTPPVYQFDCTTQEVCFEALRQGDKSPYCSPCALILQVKKDKEYTCSFSFETLPYLWEHKHNGVAIVPGAFYVELAYASIMAGLRPKKPVSSLQLTVMFQNLLTLGSNCHQLKITVDRVKSGAAFTIQSSAATLASGTCNCTDGQQVLEEQTIGLEAISQRCKKVLKRNEIYSLLSQAGFEYGSIFKQLDNVHFGDAFQEAVSTIQIPLELVKDLHEYFIHPVLLDYFLQMTAVLALRQLVNKLGLPSSISNVTISGPMQQKMSMYIHVTQEAAEFFEVCGCFCTVEGWVLVEFKGVRISFLGTSSNTHQSLFFHNEITSVVSEKERKCPIKALVFEDTLGIAKALRPYLHPDSITIKSREFCEPGQLQELVFHSLNTDVGLSQVLFIWTVEDISHTSPEKTLEGFVICCELFRQVVLALKESRRSCTVRVITYRLSDMIVDHISPGFVLSGMMRACAAELAGLTFQLIDLASVTSEDTQTLVQVINTCKQQEIIIRNRQASATRIVQTPINNSLYSEGDTHALCLRDFVLQTSDPYRMMSLSAIPCDRNENTLREKSVEIHLTNVCAHSSDYFPVSVTHLEFGKTVYWSKHSSQNHKLLALDFSGVVTAVRKGVNSLSVGDRIAACYPVVASTKIVIPEGVCYSAKSLPFLREIPCMSYFILAWEILQRILQKVKQRCKSLAIVSSNMDSVLIKVLALTANRSGWSVSSLSHFRADNLERISAFVFLPPFDSSWQEICDSNGLERYAVFVCSSLILSSARMLAMKSEHVHIHTLDVCNVLQKANLKAQNRNVYHWLMSLSIDVTSLPLARGIFQLSSAKDRQIDAEESYFTTKIIQQVILGHEGSDSPVSDFLLLSRPEKLFQQRFVYIVTGGLSGLGLETVKFIAHNGGGCIATLSRRVLSAEGQFEMRLLQQQYGVKIVNLQCDVSVSTQVVEAISKIERLFSCPIKGVFHSAAVLHDALIENLDQSLFRMVLKPKVCGALNLHYATLNKKLDFFVCYSSISSFIGNASQCNYAAANSFLDSFCHYRRNRGLAGQSINWGPLNLGLLLKKDHFQKFLEEKGMMIMDVCEVFTALETCLLLNKPQQVICKFNFKNLNHHVLSQNTSLRERLAAFVQTEVKDASNKTNVQHSASSMCESVRKIVSDMSGVDADELEDDLGLSALGIDSMLAMTLQNRIFQETGVNVPLVRILDPNSTLTTLIASVENSE
ncbi:phthioceranic/hydroxyphthioceranic acid synthase [Thalassophryne amazonica]|uniref:phthioceranic/hydroxyphthioceranic acid synthase n=1 Tax=Thalassophryne amazonica TaxID=390379 RepID=UPI001471D9D3|nr:phthioceranic/hydroxyphthioceranic acid synthase [Thalassophryne amazonica]